MSTVGPARSDPFALVSDSFAEGWRRMAKLMFRRPSASLRRWFVWGLIIVMAGLAGNGGGGGFNFSRGSHQDLHFPGMDIPGIGDLPSIIPGFWIWVAVLVALCAILVVLWLYFQARFRLVFLEGVLAGEPRIRGVFKQTSGPGLAYFLFNLIVTVVFLAALGVFIALWAASLAPVLSRGGSPSPGVVVFLILSIVLYAIPLAIAFALLHWFVHHLVLPHLWLRRESFGAAFGRAWRLTREHFGATLLFLIGQFVANVVAVFLKVIVFCCTCWIWCWPGIVIYGLAAATALALPLAILTAPVIMIIGFLIVWFFASVTAPIPVFLRSWSLAFVAGTDPTLSVAAAAFAPAVPVTSGPALSEPPPPEQPPPPFEPLSFDSPVI